MAERRLQFIIEAENRADKVFRDVERSLDGMQGRLKELQPQFKKMAIAGGAAFGAISAGIGLSVRSAIEFESTFAGVRKTVDASEEQFKDLEVTMRNLAKTIPVSTSELNRIGELAGQLGVPAGSIGKFTETVAKLGVTTNLASEEAASAIARMANIMQVSLDDVDRMGATIVDLGNNFATTEAEIVEFGLRIAGAGKVAGLTSDEVLGIGAALSSVGIQAEAGGTAVQKVLIEMQRAAVLGGDKLSAFASVAGMSANEFSKAWEEDAANAFIAFVEGISARGDKAVQVFEDIEMQDVRLVRSFLSLANAGDLLRRTIDKGSTAWQENSALTEEARKKFETTEKQIQLLRNQINDAAIVLGDAFLPMLNNLIKAITPFIIRLSEWIEKNPELSKWILIITASIVGLVAVIGTLGLILPVIITGFTLLLGPIGLVALAIGGLTVATVLLITNWKDVKEFFQLTWEGIKIIFENAIDSIMEKLEPLINFVDSVISRLQMLRSLAGEAGGSIGQFFTGPFQRTLGGFQFGGEVPRTGNFLLHKGERVISAGEAAMGGGVTVNINGGFFLSENVAEEIGDMVVRKLNRTMKL